MKSILSAGIDVSKVYENNLNGVKRLITDVDEEQKKLSREDKESNTKKEVKKRESKKGYNNIHFVMELTGSYHIKRATILAQQGYNVYVLNPLIIRRYSEENLKRAKTDNEDSKLLSIYVYNALVNSPLSSSQSTSPSKSLSSSQPSCPSTK
jgi:transposase